MEFTLIYNEMMFFQLNGVTWWTRVTPTSDDVDDLEMSESYSVNARKPQLSKIAKDPRELIH